MLVKGWSDLGHTRPKLVGLNRPIWVDVGRMSAKSLPTTRPRNGQPPPDLDVMLGRSSAPKATFGKLLDDFATRRDRQRWLAKACGEPAGRPAGRPKSLDSHCRNRRLQGRRHRKVRAVRGVRSEVRVRQIDQTRPTFDELWPDVRQACKFVPISARFGGALPGISLQCWLGVGHISPRFGKIGADRGGGRKKQHRMALVVVRIRTRSAHFGATASNDLRFGLPDPRRGRPRGVRWS